MTLAELWHMAQGRLQAQRQLLIGQANVLFFDGPTDALEHFVRTGSLDTGRRNVIPCSTAYFEAMQRQKDERKSARGRK